MYGYPKKLNTREDYLYAIQNFPKNLWEKDVQALLDTMYDWFFVKHLDKKEDGIESDSLKIVENVDNETKEKTYDQYQLKETGNLERIGFKKEELEYILKNGGIE